MKCPLCGSEHTEEHGTGPAELPWWLCRDCGIKWYTSNDKPDDSMLEESGFEL